MSLLRTMALPLLGLALLAAPAAAQTRPNKMARRPQPHVVPNNTPAADPLRGKSNSKGISGYAAPGQPINEQDNGKRTPPYDGPAVGRTITPNKSMSLPPKQ